MLICCSPEGKGIMRALHSPWPPRHDSFHAGRRGSTQRLRAAPGLPVRMRVAWAHMPAVTRAGAPSIRAAGGASPRMQSLYGAFDPQWRGRASWKNAFKVDPKSGGGVPLGSPGSIAREDNYVKASRGRQAAGRISCLPLSCLLGTGGVGGAPSGMPRLLAELRFDYVIIM